MNRLIKLVAYVQLNTSGSPIVKADRSHFNGSYRNVTIKHAKWEGHGITVIKEDDMSQWPEGDVISIVVLTTKKGTYRLNKSNSNNVFQGKCNGTDVTVTLRKLEAHVEFSN